MKRKQARQALQSRLHRQLALSADESKSRRVRTKAARYSASLAEQLGIIDRPKRCEWCRKRLELERHHPDYAEPLSVYFLCRACHDFADTSALSESF